ncbi:MAG: PH domain-containing protein [Armatimonadetes bacterium]|nr:PH domain-containing protein [Armatimonadota bacterium]
MKQVFPIIPSSNGVIWFYFGFSFLMLGLMVFMGYVCLGARRARFEVSDSTLKITGALYGRKIPLSDIDGEGAKPLNLEVDTQYRLVSRTNGAGLPGYAEGWFRLKNGEKCLAFVTDSRSVLYVPTRKGYAVMMSVARPEELRDALRSSR